MFRVGSGWVISPADLVDVLECQHRSALRYALAAEVAGAPAPAADPLTAEAGHEQLQADLCRLRAVFGDGVVTIPAPRLQHGELCAAAEATRDAMRARVPVIHQGVIYTPVCPGVAFYGRVDFLIAAAVDPERGVHRTAGRAGYEPWHVLTSSQGAVGAIVQLAACADVLTGRDAGPVEFVHLKTGEGQTQSLRARDYVPLVRLVRDRVVRRLSQPAALPDPVWGEPCAACETCGYATWCTQGRARDRHVSLVAGIRSDQVTVLQDAGITTIDALAQAGEDKRPPLLARRTYARLREQAALQVRQDATRTAENPTGQVFATVYADDGLAMLPPPSDADVVITLKSHPVGDERDLVYLYSAFIPREERYCVWWAHDRAQERAAFAAFVDYVHQQLTVAEDAHLYFYDPQGMRRLAALAAALGTREAEVDDLLRQRRCVDVCTVVKKSVRVSQRSYALRSLEPLYLDAEHLACEGEPLSDTYAAYQRACQVGEEERAEKIRDVLAARARQECVSVARLRDWLEKLRVDHGILARPAPVVGDDTQGDHAARRRARR